jgi:hypothetical protein
MESAETLGACPALGTSCCPSPSLALAGAKVCSSSIQSRRKTRAQPPSQRSSQGPPVPSSYSAKSKAAAAGPEAVLTRFLLAAGLSLVERDIVREGPAHAHVPAHGQLRMGGGGGYAAATWEQHAVGVSTGSWSQRDSGRTRSSGRSLSSNLGKKPQKLKFGGCRRVTQRDGIFLDEPNKMPTLEQKSEGGFMYAPIDIASPNSRSRGSRSSTARSMMMLCL